jgi:hypothetical protein
MKTAKKHKRSRPCYLSFASDWMADELYATATAAERGLVFSLQNFCWTNGSAPRDPGLLARLLSLSSDEVGRVKCPLVTKHFQPCPTQQERLYCPELERQRAEDAEFRRKVSEGGRSGGIQTQRKYRDLKSSRASSPAKALEKRGDEKRQDELSKKGDSSLAPDLKEWVDEYAAEGQAEAYRRATKGN